MKFQQFINILWLINCYLTIQLTTILITVKASNKLPSIYQGSNCPNITRNSRFKCAQSLEEQACGCYVKAYKRWLNSSVSVSHEKGSCCSKLEVKNCVERLLRVEKRECKNRWEKEAKRYADLVLPVKEYSCRDYRKQEYCKLDSINLTLIILLITVALLAIVACLGFTGYACYRRYNE